MPFSASVARARMTPLPALASAVAALECSSSSSSCVSAVNSLLLLPSPGPAWRGMALVIVAACIGHTAAVAGVPLHCLAWVNVRKELLSFYKDMCVIVLDLYQVQQPQSTKHQALVTPVGRLSCVKYDFIVPPLQLQCESKCRRLMRPSKRPTSTSRALLPSGMLGCRFHQDQPQKYKSKLSEGIQAPH